MCAPSTVQKAIAGLSRRELVALASTGLLSAAVPASARAILDPTPWQARNIRANKVIDLTHTLSHQFPVIPIPGLTFPFEIKPIATLEKNGVYATEWHLIDHNGTHIDAPCHFIEGQPSLEKVSHEVLISPIAVIDVKDKAAKDADYALTPDDIRAWEKTNGRLPDGAAVFMNSGWGSKTADAKAFLNMDDSHTMHFPGFTAETCDFLIHERKIHGIGVDTISFDLGADKEYKAHHALFRGGKWGIECIANLDELPPVGATAFAGALKVEGASGSPIRLLGLF